MLPAFLSLAGLTECSMAIESMTGVKKPRGIRHDRHCQRCRAKGIKCDLNRPRCQPCLRSEATCQYPQRVIWMGEKQSRTTSPKTRPSKSPGISPIPLYPSPTVPTRRTEQPSPKETPINLYGFIDLLSHSYQEIATSKKDLPDEAIQLISRTLSFARSRLDGADNKDALQFHLVALSNLSKVIESANPIALFGIATFAMFEVCCGSFGHWQRHLQGARSLLDLHCRDKADLDALTGRIPGLADVLAYLLWFDVTGALVRGDKLIFEDWHRGILSSPFFESVGCPSDTFELFVKLVKGDGNLDMLDLSARAMDQTLRIDSSDSSDGGLVAMVYRCAGSIEAFSRAATSDNEGSGSDMHGRVIASLVDKVCDAITRIPPISRFYVHLATPAFLACMHVCHPGQCEVLRVYWRNCRLCEFPRYPDAEEQCERRWRCRLLC